jgi:hypothetical protein
MARCLRLCLVCKAQAGQQRARKAGAEFFQRPAAGDRLGHSFGEFIKLVVHNFPFVWFVFFISARTRTDELVRPRNPRFH